MRGVPLPRRDWSEPGRGGSFSLDDLDKIILSELVGEPESDRGGDDHPDLQQGVKSPGAAADRSALKRQG